MHLVFLNQYYPPDAAPTGVMLEAVVEELAAQGHRVTVLCAEGGYAGERHKTARRKTQEEDVGRDGFTHPSHLSPSARGENESACGGRAAPDEVGRLRKGDPTMIRIGATRFGRGTFWGKLMDYVSYYLGVAWRLAWMNPRPGRVVALTTPPYLSVLARAMSKIRGADHAHWVMDVYPDVMVAHGMLREGSFGHRWLAALSRWGLGGKRCAAVVTLGPDMAERIGGQGAGGRESMGSVGDPAWVPLWGEGDEVGAASHEAVRALRRQRGWKDREMIVMYSGNMGLGHRFGEILEVIGQKSGGRGQESGGRGGFGGAPHFSPAACGEDESAFGGPAVPDEVGRMRQSDPTRFVFFGGGRRRGEIAEFIAAHPGCPAELHDYVPREQLAVHLQTADLHLVSLEPSWTGTMLPSKLQGIFAVARPVVFIGDERSSLARWIVESGGGWVVKPGDVGGLLAAIDEASSPHVRTLRGRAAQAYAMTHFDRATNAREVAGRLSGCSDLSSNCCPLV